MDSNFENMTPEEISCELQNGAKFVRFAYCYSYLVCTTHGYSQKIFLIKNGECALQYSWPYILFSLFLGWWGIPWGLIYTPWALFVNLTGGKDITDELLESDDDEEEEEEEEE